MRYQGPAVLLIWFLVPANVSNDSPSLSYVPTMKNVVETM